MLFALFAGRLVSSTLRALRRFRPHLHMSPMGWFGHGPQEEKRRKKKKERIFLSASGWAGLGGPACQLLLLLLFPLTLCLPHTLLCLFSHRSFATRSCRLQTKA